MFNLIQSGDYGDLNPELMDASPVYRAVLDTARAVDAFGVDPTVAITTLAMAPVALRVLRMFNEVLTSAVENHNEDKKFERQKKRDAYEEKQQMKADQRDLWLKRQEAKIGEQPGYRQPRTTRAVPRSAPKPAPQAADPHPYAEDYEDEVEDDLFEDDTQ